MKTLPYDLVDDASREPCLDFRGRPGRGTTSGRPPAEPRPGLSLALCRDTQKRGGFHRNGIGCVDSGRGAAGPPHGLAWIAVA